jgi:PKD repeat protein
VYYWDFENDGVTDASGPGLSSVRHTYAAFGETTTRLSVTNAHGVGTTSFITFRVQPSVIYVAPGNPSAAAPYATWETAAAMPAEALTYAFDGSRVLVSNGTYRLPAPIVIERAITFESVGGRDVTTLHADGNFQAVSLRNAGLVFRGFTVTNGYGGDTGGGIHILSGTAERCRVSGGRGPYRFVRGFCVHNEGGTIRDSEIGWCEPVETNVTSSSAILYGVGLYMSGENAVAERCVIRENTGNNTHKSSTHSFGVGVMMTGGLLRSCLVTKNTQRNGREGNEKAFAAGIYLSGGKVVNCTVAGNRAEGGSAGIYAAGGRVVNTLLADNLRSAGAVANAAGPGVFAYCRADAADGLAGTGVTTAEPLFVGEGDYRLQPASPLARAGLNDPALLNGATDLAGRPLADSRNRVPIGCYATPSAATMFILH